jgi:uracil-DNA glycosylase family 4
LSERDELLQLASALRAHAEWQLVTGVTGSPASETRPRAATPARTGGANPPPARGSSYSQGAQGNSVGGARGLGASSGLAAQRGNAAQGANIAATRGNVAEDESRRGSPVTSAGSEEHPATGNDADPAVARAGSAPRAPLSPEREAARVRLVALADEIKSCTQCALYAGRTQTVFARGNTAAELCFVGEGPGADEDAEGFPFVGKAGQLLDRMIAAMGFARDEVYVCNIVKCRPPNNRKPEPEEMSKCSPYLREQLELVAPKAIVALGASAVEGLLGAGGGITRLRGQWKLYRGTVPVMPTFHPAYLLRTPEAKRDVWADLQVVLKQLGRTPPTGRSA